ncbi:MAG: hypothetical protein ACKN9V_04445 [Pseudomonadota bacterium]
MNVNPPYLSLLQDDRVKKAKEDCPQFVKGYQLDSSELGAVQSLNSSGALAVTPGGDDWQTAIIGAFNPNSLTPEQKNQIFEANSAIPKDVKYISPKKVVFRKYIADIGNPKKLGAIELQVGNTLAQLPMGDPDFPPPPECQIEVVTPQPVQMGSAISLNIKADSVVLGAGIGFANNSDAQNILKEQVISDGQLSRFPVQSIGTMQKINQNSISISLTKEDLANPLMDISRNSANES